MQTKIRRIILCLCWILSHAIFAQNTFSLKNERINIKPIGYHIAGIIDARSQKQIIGNIITANETRESITLEGGIRNNIQNFISKNLPKDNYSVPVLYRITTLTTAETKQSNGQISGKMSLVVSFEKIGKNDTTALVSSNVYTNYNRTGGTPNLNNYEAVLRPLIIQTLKYFDDWMEINNEKHEAFAKGIKIDFLPDFNINDEDTIYYETRKINWDDFRAKPTSLSRYGASIFTNFGYSSSFRVTKGLIRAVIQTKTYMVRGMSWVFPTAQNDYALAHEQLHFDITKLVVERFKKKIALMQAETIDDINSMIQYEYLESYKEMNRLQKEYDGETQHSLDRAKQAEWAQKIRTWLEENT